MRDRHKYIDKSVTIGTILRNTLLRQSGAKPCNDGKQKPTKNFSPRTSFLLLRIISINTFYKSRYIYYLWIHTYFIYKHIKTYLFYLLSRSLLCLCLSWGHSSEFFEDKAYIRPCHIPPRSPALLHPVTLSIPPTVWTAPLSPSLSSSSSGHWPILSCVPA